MRLENQYDIGIYDSGIGGLTIAYALLQQQFPLRILYYADNAFLPLGDKSPEIIRERTIKAIDFFEKYHCNSVLIACNTAATVCYDSITEHRSCLSILNVVDTLMGSLKNVGYDNILLFSTTASHNSGVFQEALAEMDIKNSCFIRAPQLVTHIEKKDEDRDKKIVQYLQELKSNCSFQPYAILLACTHYPLIRHLFMDVFGREVKILDAINPTVQFLQEMISPTAIGEESTMDVHCTLGLAETLINHYAAINAGLSEKDAHLRKLNYGIL